MSRRAIVDPDEMHRFAVFLNGMVSSIRYKKSSLNVSYGVLKEVWKDEKYRRFEAVYSDTMRELDKFCINAELFSQYLKAKEKPLRKYLERY